MAANNEDQISSEELLMDIGELSAEVKHLRRINTQLMRSNELVGEMYQAKEKELKLAQREIAQLKGEPDPYPELDEEEKKEEPTPMRRKKVRRPGCPPATRE